jgi:beta-glucosidase
VPSTKNFPKNYTYWDDMELNDAQKAQWPCINETSYEEGINVGYRYFLTNHKAVSFPFGFGLGYTTFAYSQAKVAKKGKGYVATVTVKNTGDRAGKEVVQLYVAAPRGTLEKPACELRAFAKTRELNPGESQTLQMTFTGYDLASYDESQQAWVTDGGDYEARFSASAEDCRQSVSFKVKAEKVKAHDVMRKP